MQRDDAPTVRIAASRRAWAYGGRGKVTRLGGRALRAADGGAVADQRILEFAVRSEVEVSVLGVDYLEVTYRYA